MSRMPPRTNTLVANVHSSITKRLGSPPRSIPTIYLRARHASTVQASNRGHVGHESKFESENVDIVGEQTGRRDDPVSDPEVIRRLGTV